MKQKSLIFLWIYLRPFFSRVLLLGVLILGSIGLQLYAPQVIRRFLDAAQAGAAAGSLVMMGLVFLVVVVGQKAVSLLMTYFSEDLGWAATNRLRADLAAHTMRLDMGFHKLHTPGEIIERIDGDVGQLAEYFSELVVHVLGNALLLIGVLALLFREDWRFGLIGLAYALVTVIFLSLVQNPMVRIWAEISKAYAHASGYLEERFGGTEDIRANGGEAYVLRGLYPINAVIARLRIKADLFGGFTFSTSHMFYILTLVATLGLAATLFLRGEMTIGAVYLMTFYIGLMESPIKYIRRQMGNLQRAAASIGRINEFFRLEPEVKDEGTAVMPHAAPSVVFNGVCFAYKDKQPAVNSEQITVNGDPSPIPSLQSPISNLVLDNVSFTLQPGQVLGILGRTGSGKTTLTRLLFRLYDVDAGAITLAGHDLRAISLADLRRSVGMVTQDVQLFEATVRDNLTLFRNYDTTRPPIPDADILTAVETLGLGDWLRSLPDGLDTRLQSGGQDLSAGQAQLLAFTRVFLRDPQVVVLDEASSRLDPATEQLLERAIDRLLYGRTGIIIAHRLQTVQRADDILIMENGRILEYGPRIPLTANPQSRFSQLLQTGMETVLV
ncbi:MAG: ABC transporter ATP-binding protein [Ardenticatenaceae bacterium]|nr:ABC transporter ATP-binding protein [Ardenticatenaceae bacterium]